MRVELLTIIDCFQVGDAGVVLLPDFSVPNDGWATKGELVLIATPDGREFETPAQFSLSHFNIADPTVSIDRRWRVTMILPNVLSADVPAGSKILVSSEIKSKLLPST